jgi:hypothetical protein
MAMDDAARSAFADNVPLYVQATTEGFDLRSAETHETLSTGHASVREALAAALEVVSAAASIASRGAVLRTDGEPDGVWRWLDATAEEDEPINGARISEVTVWELASSLNASSKPAPINGGGAEDGYVTSEPHGDARNGDGAHPANGWAHAAVVVYAADGRPHLYLWCELIESVAKEVDRGRLAFGSVFFAFEKVDEVDNFAAVGAVLISHALTNDPAVTTLSPGSERSGRRQCRSRWSRDMTSTKSNESTENRAAREGEEAPVEGEARAMPMGEEAEAFAASCVGLFAELLGKPDASPADLLAEIEASKEALGAALGTDTAPDDDAGEDPPAEGEESAEARGQVRAARARLSREKAARAAIAKELEAERGKVLRFETVEWLDGQLRASKRSLPSAKRDRWVDIAIRNGREVVTEMLDNLNAPPSGPHPIERAARGAETTLTPIAPTTVNEACAVYEETAREQLAAEESKQAARQHRKPVEVPEHHVRSRAQVLARAAHPELFTGRAATR